jgi:hypothetical protein
VWQEWNCAGMRRRIRKSSMQTCDVSKNTKKEKYDYSTDENGEKTDHQNNLDRPLCVA